MKGGRDEKPVKWSGEVGKRGRGLGFSVRGAHNP